MPGCVAIDGKGAFCRWSAISNLVLGDAGARRLVLVVRSQNRFHCRWPDHVVLGRGKSRANFVAHVSRRVQPPGALVNVAG